MGRIGAFFASMPGKAVTAMAQALNAMGTVLYAIPGVKNAAEAMSGFSASDGHRLSTGERVLGAGLSLGEVGFTGGQLGAAERQLAEHGVGALEKSLGSLTDNLAEHMQKLADVRTLGGHTSSIEREIRNFQGQINAIRHVLENAQ